MPIPTEASPCVFYLPQSDHRSFAADCAFGRKTGELRPLGTDAVLGVWGTTVGVVLCTIVGRGRCTDAASHI